MRGTSGLSLADAALIHFTIAPFPTRRERHVRVASMAIDDLLKSSPTRIDEPVSIDNITVAIRHSETGSHPRKPSGNAAREQLAYYATFSTIGRPSDPGG